MSLVEVDGVSKFFRHQSDRRMLRDYLMELFTGRSRTRDRFHALDDVSFSIDRGESVALLGTNGAGKTTLLSLLCGLARPDQGRVRVNGPVAPLLALGAGFHPDLTGRENLFLNASLLGMSELDAKALFPAIVDFAELGAFIDDPLRVYSAGMTLRLGFAIAVHCNASLVVIDEVMAVGDLPFQQKCLARLRRLREEGRSLICVSHSIELLREFCDRGIWLHHGKVELDGPVDAVTEEYVRFLSERSVSARV